MANKIAVAILHGVGIHHRGTQDYENMQALAQKINEKFGGKPTDYSLEFELIHWDEEASLQKREDDLENTLRESGVRFGPLPDVTGVVRKWVYDRITDVVSYQPVRDPKLQSESTYYIIHVKVAEGLNNLSNRAGPEAPLCIIAHSFGSVIASNYIYDLQQNSLRARPITPTPLENGDTLGWLFTMGNPLAMWRLRTGELVKPISVENWINFYSSSDIVAYPLAKVLNQDNNAEIVQDIQVYTGWIFSAHEGYWRNEQVVSTIVECLRAYVHKAQGKLI
jgi:hypothetical protein